jgi:diacylglycerol kinase family enzyme
MRAGTDVVVAFGGDGTVNEVINGLLTDGVHDAVPALGVVPAGSTNVFARALGLPRQPIEATGALLEALRSGVRRAVSLGKADERWFAFAAGMGFDAAVVAGVERQRRRGRPSTHALYARVGVREYLRTSRRRGSLRAELDDGTSYDDIHFAMVTNTDPWTYMGPRPLRPTPDASFDDGLALYARRRMGAAGLLFSLARMSGTRPHVGSRGAHVRYDIRELTLHTDEPMPFQVDGDYLGLRDKVRFSSTTRALEVACSLDAAALVA